MNIFDDSDEILTQALDIVENPMAATELNVSELILSHFMDSLEQECSVTAFSPNKGKILI